MEEEYYQVRIDVTVRATGRKSAIDKAVDDVEYLITEHPRQVDAFISLRKEGERAYT